MMSSKMDPFTKTLRRTMRRAHLRLVYSSSRSTEENLRSIREALAKVQQAVAIPPAPPSSGKVLVSLPAVPIFDLPAVMRDPALVQQEINGCKSLLLEIVRRAAYDWVLYRTHRRLLNRKIAEQAYHWLFLESENDPEGRERTSNEKQITSFLAICQALDLDAASVRAHIKKLTPKNVMSVGRPAEYRRRDSAPSMPEEAPVALKGRLLEEYAEVEESGQE